MGTGDDLWPRGNHRRDVIMAAQRGVAQLNRNAIRGHATHADAMGFNVTGTVN